MDAFSKWNPLVMKNFFLLEKINEYKKRLQCRDQFTINKAIEYEKRWRYLKKKYDGGVHIYGIEFVGIGETVPRLFMFLRDKKSHKLSKGLHVVLPTFYENYRGGIFNKGIFSVFGKYVYFITEKNFSFWHYIFLFHAREVDSSQFERYQFREAVRFDMRNKPIMPFNERITKYANKKMQRMGIEKEFICLHAREVETKTANFNDYPDTSVCDAKLESFAKACEHMSTLGYQAVRMGRDEKKECTIDGVIDYANQFYDGLMDFYLIANCKFLIGSPSGLSVITPYWGRPLLLTNNNTFCWGHEALPMTGKDLYLPKKFYSKTKERYLNLYEMLNVSHKCDRYTKNYRMERIELIDNTEEEILEAVIELNAKLDHTWEETEDERRCMEKYWKIMALWKSRHQAFYRNGNRYAKGYEMIFIPIAYSFLKKNRFLLEGEDIE